MQSRRNFLKILGIGTATAAIPTTALALAKSPKTTAAISSSSTRELPTPKPLPTNQITPILQKLVNKHERYQVRAHNGDNHISCKTICSTAWQQLADKVANEIEELAQACNLTVIWPGINPEFYRRPHSRKGRFRWVRQP